MQNNKTIQILQSTLGFTKDMSISDWIRAPFLFLSAVLKFLIKNLLSIILIVVTIVIIYFLFKFFKWWKKEREMPGLNIEDYENIEDETQSKKS